MIPFDFEYYRPDSLEEAVDLYQRLSAKGKEPMYYSGGTEIISFARLYQLYPKAVIDIKGISQCNLLELNNNELTIGSAVTLTQIQESNLFPLLSWCGGRVADHTIRCKITLGGNICARIPYRESVLALLVADSEVGIMGPNGFRRIPINQAFNQVLHLEKGELLTQVITEKAKIKLPFYSTKKTTDGEVSYPQNHIGYPVLSAAAVMSDQGIKIAFSGLCNFPFRSREVEEQLNQKGISLSKRIKKSVKSLPAPVISDMEGSAQYRAFVFENTVAEIMEKLEAVPV